MAERSHFWTTGTTGDGTSTYTESQLGEWLTDLFITDQEATEGVLLGTDNELAVSGSASPLSVATGAAIVEGFYYKNTAVVSLAVTTPTIGTTGGHVILRVSHGATRTVRLVAVRNTDGVIGIPSLTQVAGTTWEIRLASFTIITGPGTITLTDTRAFAHFATAVNTAMLDASSVTSAKIATSVAGAGLTGGAGTALAVNVDSTTIEIASDILRISATAAGSGLTGGGGSALAVGAGTGITVNANDVAVTTNGISNTLIRQGVANSVIGRATNSTGNVADIQATVDGTVFRLAGTTLTFATLGTSSYADNSVSDAKLRDSAGLTVIGRSVNSAGDPDDIQAAVDGHVLRLAGVTLGFGTVATAGIADAAVTDIKIRTCVANSVMGRATNSAGTVDDIQATVDGQVLRLSGTTLGFGTVATAGITNDAVDDTKAGNRVPQWYRRQGGDANDWSVQGSTDRTPGAVRIQSGVLNVTINNLATLGFTTATYPVAYSQVPMTLCGINAPGLTTDTDVVAYATFGIPDTDLISLQVRRSNTTGSSTYTLWWIAIGTE